MVRNLVEGIIEKTANQFNILKKQGEEFVDIGYDEINGMIYCMYGEDFQSEVKYANHEGKFLYNAGKEVFSVNKLEEGKTMIQGDIPSMILNSLQNYNLKLVRVVKN